MTTLTTQPQLTSTLNLQLATSNKIPSNNCNPEWCNIQSFGYIVCENNNKQPYNRLFKPPTTSDTLVDKDMAWGEHNNKEAT